MTRLILKVGILVGGAILFCVVGEATDRGQVARANVSDLPATHEQEKEDSSFDPNKAKFRGAASCKGCHTRPDYDTDFVQLNEYNVWKNQDKHSKAYERLKDKRSLDMAERLGYDPVKSDACLNCHSMNYPPERHGPLFDLADGVSCDGCHGPATGWFQEHIEPDWRVRPTSYKEKKGMWDLRDNVRRTKLCLSCHVGNVAEGKVLTHEMYAAGHPPLPSIEIAAFSQAMPQHWRLMKDVPFFKDRTMKKPPQGYQDPAVLKKKVEELYDPDSAPFERTKLLLISTLVALDQAVTESSAYAHGKAKFRHADPMDKPKDKTALPKQLTVPVLWPELSTFDCYACHHDLKKESWRQERGYIGKPGRPNMRPWPLALAQLVSHLKTKEEERKRSQEQFAILTKQFIKAYDNEPFGTPADIAMAARAVAEWCDRGIVEVRDKRFTRSDTRNLLIALGEISKGPALDYDAARQVAWAFKVMCEEYDSSLNRDQEIAEGLRKLEEILKLSLPQGQQPVDSHLGAWLALLNHYEPRPFQQTMAALVDRVSKMKE